MTKITKKAKQIYTVIEGDTFWSISRKFDGISVDDIKKANPEVIPETIKPGQKISIPFGEEASEKKNQQSAIGSLKQFEDKIKSIAESNDIPTPIFRGLVAYESSGNPMASANKQNPSKGAQGLTQLMPKTRELVGVIDPYDVDQNLKGGARWLKICYTEAKRLKNIVYKSEEDTWQMALMIYHAGMPAVQKWINSGMPETGIGLVGEKTIKYPYMVFEKGRDQDAFRFYWK